ncbi:primosomal protein N' [Bacillus sp. FJAT-50079]|uniref:primosomal protein N' n=1 Tax=Bacillus sp. FJAT-50079 TaxID=2833577 RepID=UPI001BC9EB90|nr:primosomal protein N' [Bacillus sp. FJAT-50079]MBS4207674.1 primosomal protein N' [Bacillus sp. FJAT-50079]
MNIATVIVDVPALGTDREFDYHIPHKWLGMIEPGMRVAVPFGPRTIQGFVTGLKDQSEFKQLKELKEPLDLTPVLNKELLELGHWLAAETLSFKISSFHAMLPAAMKAKYEKKFLRIDTKDHPFLNQLFQDRMEVSWKEAEERDLLRTFHEEIKTGNVELIYEVKNRTNKKMVRMLIPIMDQNEIRSFIESLDGRAAAQRRVLDHIVDTPSSKYEANALEKMTNTSSATVKALIEKGVFSEIHEEVYRDPYGHRDFTATKPLPLTEEQAAAIQPIFQTLAENIQKTFLLYGVTGSGKTEIYLQSIQEVLRKGQEAIVLVPEIALTPQMVERFKSRFGNDVAVLHSGLSNGEKYDEWRKIQRKEAKVVVGARSAIFAPFENIGIIIIDEEHETSYKQEEAPRYHARDVAIQRAMHHRCPVILGSATPSLESFARAKKGVYELLTLSKRMNNKGLPPVSIVDMREEMRNGNRSMFSKLLFEKIVSNLEKKEQTILFLNRRGHSSFMMCRDCGFVMQCPNCDISLTYHRYSKEMKCHYCGYDTNVPQTCPDCSSTHIRYFGTGTQKVEEELLKLLPEVRIVRMDVDTTSRKGAHEKLLNHFKSGQADILLGTQMIAKGLDFPNVTLVGILSADTMLHLPDFRASEKTFQLLTQVSGRAGRHELSGEVVIQTYTPEHYSIQTAGMQDYDRFYQQEMMMRKIGSYPPFYYITMITISHENVMHAFSATEKIAKYISSFISESAILLGPVASPIARINNRYRYQCLIKYKHEPQLNHALKKVIEHYQQQYVKEGLTISIDVNPYMMM